MPLLVLVMMLPLLRPTQADAPVTALDATRTYIAAGTASGYVRVWRRRPAGGASGGSSSQVESGRAGRGGPGAGVSHQPASQPLPTLRMHHLLRPHSGRALALASPCKAAWPAAARTHPAACMPPAPTPPQPTSSCGCCLLPTPSAAPGLSPLHPPACHLPVTCPAPCPRPLRASSPSSLSRTCSWTACPCAACGWGPSGTRRQVCGAGEGAGAGAGAGTLSLEEGAEVGGRVQRAADARGVARRLRGGEGLWWGAGRAARGSGKAALQFPPGHAAVATRPLQLYAPSPLVCMRVRVD